MRLSFAFLLTACLMLFGGYQVRSQEPLSVKVVKFSWVKERIGWEGNPLNATVENASEARERARTERRVTSPLEERLNRAQKEEQKVEKEPPRYVFNYKVSVRNDGTNAIKEIDWDYIFTDGTTGETLGRREFTSVVKIAAGRRRELSVRVSSPPTQTISVYKLGEKEGAGLVQDVVILRILYEDGTVWKVK